MTPIVDYLLILQVGPSIYLSIHIFIYLVINLSILPSSIFLSTYLSVYPYIHLLFYLSIHPSNSPSNSPSIHPTVHPSIYPSIHPSINPSFRPFIHPSIHPFHQSSLSTKLTDLNETATEKLSAANEGLMNATVLYERMISLRNISHTQMLHARGMIYRYIKTHVYIHSIIYT